MQKIPKGLVPPPLRKALRSSQGAVLDLLDLARGRDLPPHHLRDYVGGGDFTAIGEEHLRYFIGYGKLRPEHKVLDVGCGSGRMALPLTRYLSPQSEYYGFDPSARSIEWCREHITTRYPNFHFEVADLLSDAYNPQGRYHPDNFRFPYQDDTFDFVFLTSVFTHLFPSALKNYFSEIVRVLRKDGRSFITYFLLNPESIALIEQRKSSLNFTHPLEGCWTAFPENPEGALGFDETMIRGLYEAGGMRIELLQYGAWCGRQSEYGGGQDLIVGVKV
jgi:ubiquinone/menaquinone biosynthesis C-methylase UbiE